MSLEQRIAKSLQTALSELPIIGTRGIDLAVLVHKANVKTPDSRPALVSLLAEIRSVEAARKAWNSYFNIGNATMLHREVDSCSWLLARSQVVGPRKATNEFLKFWRNRSATVIGALVVNGFTVPKKLKCDAYHLTSWEDYPQTRSKQYVNESQFGVGAIVLPHAVIMTTKRVTVKFMKSANEPTVEFADSARMRDLVRCLVIASGVGVTPLFHWTEWAPETPLNLAGMQVAGASQMLRTPRVLNEKVVREADGLLHSLENMDLPNSVDLLRLCIDRLNDSLNTKSIVSSALDLGIAAESILLENDNKEIRFRFALHAARFVENTLDRRKQVHNVMKKVYDLRSSVAHSGKIPANSMKDAKSTVAAGQDILRRVVALVINNGGTPDWDELVLN